MIYVTKLDENVNKELNRKNMLSWLIVLLIGIGVTAFGVIATLFSLLESFYCSLMMVIGMLFITFSLICIIIILKMGKEQKNSNIELVYDFLKKYVILKRMENGTEIESEKIYYKYIIKTRKTKNYIYIYRSDKTVIPFCTRDVNLEDLKTIENYFSTCND
jgi:hypothetical protein